MKKKSQTDEEQKTFLNFSEWCGKVLIFLQRMSTFHSKPSCYKLFIAMEGGSFAIICDASLALFWLSTSLWRVAGFIIKNAFGTFNPTKSKIENSLKCLKLVLVSYRLGNFKFPKTRCDGIRTMRLPHYRILSCSKWRYATQICLWMYCTCRLFEMLTF
jgi:hypothetical protein